MAKAKRKENTKNKALIYTIFVLVILAAVAGAYFTGLLKPDDLKKIWNKDANPSVNDTTEVHFIDVGQGDCELVISEGKSLLIDTGEKENAENICEYLKAHGIETINYFLLTHPHSDHMGGAYKIVDEMEIENIITPRVPDSVTPTTKFYEKFLKSVQKKGLKLTEAKAGNTYEIGACKLELVAPLKDDYGDNYNNYSAAAYLTHGDKTFFFAGDIEKKAEKDIVEAGLLKKTDVLKVAHHGSSTSSCKSFLDAADPDIAVICCKKDNSYNHPNDKTVERLKKYVGFIYRTDESGTIIIKSSEDGLSVETEK